MSETKTVTKPILDALTKAGYFAMRLNSGKVRVRGGFLQLCPEGTADIVIYPAGRVPIWVETKAAKLKKDHHKEQQEAQGRFRDRVEALGHTYIVARSLDDVLAVLRTEHLL